MSDEPRPGDLRTQGRGEAVPGTGRKTRRQARRAAQDAFGPGRPSEPAPPPSVAPQPSMDELEAEARRLREAPPAAPRAPAEVVEQKKARRGRPGSSARLRARLSEDEGAGLAPWEVPTPTSVRREREERGRGAP